MNNAVWIGLFELKVGEENKLLTNCKFAYVNALAKAENERDFIKKVASACRNLHFLVEDAEDVELYESRAKHFSLSQEIQSLAKKASAENEVSFDIFHGSEN